MLLQTLPLSQLKPAPYNPRPKLKPGDPAWEKLSRSLDEFDLVQPIVWNQRTGHVVSGHQRLEILRTNGRTEVECVVVDLPLPREKALNVTLNNAEVAADWDPDKLVHLLDELHSLPDFDATLTGFDAAQLGDLLLTPSLTPPAAVEEEPVEPHMSVTLTVPPDEWDEVEPALDDLLTEFPSLRCHVRRPDGT